MKTSKNNGGPAFPRPGFLSEMTEPAGLVAKYENMPQTGMTLRDYFAAKIACGDAASGEGWDTDNMRGDWARRRAEGYYFLADAMLLARKK